MTKPADMQMQQVLDVDFWVDQARRSIDSVASIMKSTIDYSADMAAQWRKLTLEMLKK